MSIRQYLRVKKLLLLALVLISVYIAGLMTYICLSLPDVSDLKTHNPTTTALIEARIEEAREKGSEIIIKQSWVSFEEIPQLLKDTVRIAEDASFYWHEGIDFEELKESIKKNIQEKRFARGGSTITQQLAKNLYLSEKKSITRKITEYFIARRLEKALSKDRIFELYLNVVEFGSNVFGVQAASRQHFGRHVSELGLEEIVRLTAVLPRPLTVDPWGESPWLLWRCRWLLHKLRLYEYISEEAYQESVIVFESEGQSDFIPHV
jgi:monofunctional biosynthetic peptidoglycan transglycosylase